MVILEDLQDKTIKEMNETVNSKGTAGISLDTICIDGKLSRFSKMGITDDFVECLAPSKKTFLLSVDSIIHNDFDLSQMLLILERFPNLILQHSNPIILRYIKEEVLAAGKKIKTATRIREFYDDQYIKSLKVDFEVHKHEFDSIVIDRVNDGNNVILDLPNVFSSYSYIARVLQETKNSENLYIISSEHKLVKKISKNVKIIK